ncbi:MAG TPA: hypothetical protein VEU30_11140 [Thermoanaerobaculia bacterium]|nr:hypothetical protein [Thermoanaerobaculia bacterium]
MIYIDPRSIQPWLLTVAMVLYALGGAFLIFGLLLVSIGFGIGNTSAPVSNWDFAFTGGLPILLLAVLLFAVSLTLALNRPISRALIIASLIAAGIMKLYYGRNEALAIVFAGAPVVIVALWYLYFEPEAVRYYRVATEWRCRPR